MDKETLSNYGWIVICILVLSVMIALATPFGRYIATAVENTTEGLFNVQQKAMDTAGLEMMQQEFENQLNGGSGGTGAETPSEPEETPTAPEPTECQHTNTTTINASATYTGDTYCNDCSTTIATGEILDLPDQNFEGSGGSNLDMSTVSATLADNDWATIQKVIKAGKVAEAGWSVGDTKSLTINGATKTATLIGIDHDGANTATFMIAEVGGIGSYAMNTGTNDGGWEGTNDGGWEVSEMRTWLNSDVYDSMTDVAPYIKSVTKMTNNIGYNGNTVSATSDKVFLLSPKECGIEWQMADEDYWDWSDYSGMDALNAEGTTYEWFANGRYINDWCWLRSPGSYYDDIFFSYANGSLDGYGSYQTLAVCPAFVIG